MGAEALWLGQIKQQVVRTETLQQTTMAISFKYAPVLYQFNMQ